ncbi:hypothetical protein [Phaeacidiphilus oryzae]|uniref:hypothetical protein n=1 Tax=Phaeacidiphilus oryzae TaxID=348818 RepID=UPI0005619BA6|nr:hypothetical protein [Phaeacidiphilus oryzae]
MRDHIETAELNDAELDAVAGGAATANVNLPGVNVHVGSVQDLEQAGFAQLGQALSTAAGNVAGIVPAGVLPANLI